MNECCFPSPPHPLPLLGPGLADDVSVPSSSEKHLGYTCFSEGENPPQRCWESLALVTVLTKYLLSDVKIGLGEEGWGGEVEEG